MGSHRSGRVGKARRRGELTGFVSLPFDTAPEVIRPYMSSKIEVLEGVAEAAVFGGQVGGDDVRVVRKAARADPVRCASQCKSLNVLRLNVRVPTPNLYRRALNHMLSEIYPLHRSSN